MSQSDGARRRIANAAPALAAGCLGMILLAGCAGNGSDGSFSGIAAAFSSSVGNPLNRPSQQGFEALIRHNCADQTIGGRPVSSLIAEDEPFRTLTSQLYRGDISNDEYINQVLRLHPADDANIPATGCIIDQLQSCLSGNCDVESAASAEAALTRQPETSVGRTSTPEVLAAEAEAAGAVVEQPPLESQKGSMAAGTSETAPQPLP